MAAPSRFKNGVTNVGIAANLNQYGRPDPSIWHTYFNDFDAFTSGVTTEWTETVIGTGTALTTGANDGGWLVLLNSAADNDGYQLQKLPNSFLLTAGKRAIFKAKFKVSDATQSDLLVGLCVADTTLLGATGGDGVTDGIFFQKDDGSAVLTAYCQKNTTTGQTSVATTTLVTDTFVTVGWYYDGVSVVEIYLNDAKVAALDGTSTYLPDVILTPSMALLNGEAVAKSLSVDFLFAAIER